MSDKPVGESPNPPEHVTTATTPSVPAGNAVALDAYRGMWAVFVSAAKTSNPDAAELRRFAADDALTLLVNSLYIKRDQGKVTLGEIAIQPRVTQSRPSADPDEVMIADCVHDEKWLTYWVSGGLVDDVPGGGHRTTATLSKTAEGWKVTTINVRSRGSC